MADCDLIYVLLDGTEFKSTKQIDEQLHLFPDNIYEKIRPEVEKARKGTTID